MNKRNKVVAVITSILLAASMASLSIPAQAEQNTDVAPMSCDNARILAHFRIPALT